MAKSNKPKPGVTTNVTPPTPPEGQQKPERKGIDLKIQKIFESNPGVNEVWHDGEDVYLSCRYSNCVKVTR